MKRAVGRFHRMLVIFFFFQAEDGIRDAQESRGLGDVYKRQLLAQRSGNKCELCEATENLKVYEVPPATGNMDDAILICPKCTAPVSYTHLTLPTIYSV